ncbi:MAG TPA: hypothetical protein VHZ51_26195 [Ktedonobacteraceae bacterium]|jgi:hypothetical protein|nr:hypothetical protein [Ktedonobacteraceae bacterium]
MVLRVAEGLAHTLAFSALTLPVRSDKAIRRHWQLVCCAFSFCWFHLSHLTSCATPAVTERPEPSTTAPTSASAETAETRKKISKAREMRPHVSCPAALRAVRAWLQPWIMLRRYWSGWSSRPPPPAVQRLPQWFERGQALALYNSA